MTYVVGTRGSRLSLSQTNQVISALKKIHPGADYRVRQITTKGDTDHRPLFTIDQKGIFEKEIDMAVAQGAVDFAVHSLKDVPSALDEGLVLACIPRREAPNDVFISADHSSLESIKPDAVIGTSSLRRAVQASVKRPDVTVRPIRGNIETRIKKIGKNYDAIILAKAGLVRLGLDVRHAILPVAEFAPSPGQGAIALVARRSDCQTIRMLQAIQDEASRSEVQAERALSDYVDSGCRFPIGAYAKSAGTEMTLDVSAFSVDGTKSIKVSLSGPADDPVQLGHKAAKKLQQQGIRHLALNWREKLEEWNKT